MNKLLSNHEVDYLSGRKEKSFPSVTIGSININCREGETVHAYSRIFDKVFDRELKEKAGKFKLTEPVIKKRELKIYVSEQCEEVGVAKEGYRAEW